MKDIILAFKTRIHLNNIQEAAFEFWAQARRIAYNYALHLCHIIIETEKRRIRNADIAEIDKYFNASKKKLSCTKGVRKNSNGIGIGTGFNEHLNSKLVPNTVCQQAIKYDLKAAWKKYHKGQGGAPRFQSYRRRKSFSLTTANLNEEMIHHGYVDLPCGMGRAKLGDAIPYENATPKGTHFIKEGGKWFISFTLHVPPEDYYKHEEKKYHAKGVDIGIDRYAATSDNEKYYAPEKLKELEKRKAGINRKIGQKLHNNLMRVVCKCEKCREKVKGIHDKRRLCVNCRRAFRPLLNSRTIQKLRASVARISCKQAQIRLNMAHQLTTSLVKENTHIAIEDLRIKNMTKSAKGDMESPGKNVKAKSGLNRALLNVAPYLFRDLLEYKADKYGRVLKAVNPRNTSITCPIPECGHVDKANRKGGLFRCTKCGHTENADVSAAKNILRKAQFKNPDAHG